MKSFETLFSELRGKVLEQTPGSHAVAAVLKGKHAIGKKIVEEAAEVWMAAEYEGAEQTAMEMAQLIYHLQVMMIACDLDLKDIYAHL